MKFLQEALNRSKNEKAYLLVPVGYPAKNCKVPDIQKKTLEEISCSLNNLLKNNSSFYSSVFINK